MSIKEDINMVKQELNSEEKFFEKAVITEKFVKKYKNVMVGSVVVVVLLVTGNIAYDLNKQSKIDDANSMLLALNKDAKDISSLAKLKSLSPALYDVWVYSQAVADKDMAKLTELKSSKTIMISDLSSYETAQDVNSLNDYSLKQGSVYKELALVQSAVLLMNDSKIDEAHQKLVQIGVDSSLSKIAQALLHYGVK